MECILLLLRLNMILGKKVAVMKGINLLWECCGVLIFERGLFLFLNVKKKAI